MARHFSALTEEIGWSKAFLRISNAFSKMPDEDYGEQHVLEWLRSQTFKEPPAGSVDYAREQFG